MEKCEIYKKVWVDVAPHERKVWKCMDFIPRKPKKAKKPKPAKKAKPAKKDKLIVKMQFKKRPKGAPVEVKALPVKEGPIKHAEDYQLQEPS